jgi:hypothetical protein
MRKVKTRSGRCQPGCRPAPALQRSLDRILRRELGDELAHLAGRRVDDALGKGLGELDLFQVGLLAAFDEFGQAFLKRVFIIVVAQTDHHQDNRPYKKQRPRIIQR